MFVRNAGKDVKTDEQIQHQQSAIMKAFTFYEQLQQK